VSLRWRCAGLGDGGSTAGGAVPAGTIQPRREEGILPQTAVVAERSGWCRTPDKTSRNASGGASGDSLLTPNDGRGIEYNDRGHTPALNQSTHESTTWLKATRLRAPLGDGRWSLAARGYTCVL